MRSSLSRPRRKRLGIDDNILPLINVVFLLLAFFMIAGQLTRQGPVKIDPPLSVSDAVPQDTGVEIHVTAEGDVYLNGEAVMADRISDAMPVGDDGTQLRIIADGDIPARRIIDLMTLLRMRGWTKVTITTQRSDT